MLPQALQVLQPPGQTLRSLLPAVHQWLWCWLGGCLGGPEQQPRTLGEQGPPSHPRVSALPGAQHSATHSPAHPHFPGLEPLCSGLPPSSPPSLTSWSRREPGQLGTFPRSAECRRAPAHPYWGGGRGSGSGVRTEVQGTLSRSWGRHVRRGHRAVSLQGRAPVPRPRAQSVPAAGGPRCPALPSASQGWEVQGWASHPAPPPGQLWAGAAWTPRARWAPRGRRSLPLSFPLSFRGAAC